MFSFFRVSLIVNFITRITVYTFYFLILWDRIILVPFFFFSYKLLLELHEVFIIFSFVALMNIYETIRITKF